jgi:two-component system, NtrC family, sensor kinase
LTRATDLATGTTPPGGSPGGAGGASGYRNSLRVELLFNLAFLSAGAVLIALWAARALQYSSASTAVQLLLVAVAVVAFVLLGNRLIDRWVLRPLAAIGRTASAIAAGEHEERVAEEGPQEIQELSRALNVLTDRLLQNQSVLAENIRSLDETNQRLLETQRELVQAEKMASLGHLAAGVAHEIGNPLGALVGYVSLQKRRGGETEILEGMERETRRIDRIVRDLLDYARPGSSVREEIDVNVSARRVVELLRSQGWLREVEVILDLATDVKPVLGDPHRLDQIFVNLLRNAETAMSGSGRVRISTRLERRSVADVVPIRRANDPPGVNYAHLRRGRDPRVAAASFGLGGEVVRLVVADNGPGVPEEKRGFVFDPFFTTKGPGEGTGLGLAIVAGAVAELNGRIDLTSPPEGGAEFEILLPVPRP